MRKILITLAAVIFAVFGLAAPASATTPADEKPVVLVNEKGESVLSVPVRASEVGILAFSDCPSSYSCYWTGTGGSGSRVYLTSIVNNGAGVTLATNIRNRTTTIRIDC
ncbi:peptidase inhibitor family I36 protein [Nonomuraea sp. NPDC049625]|uniref:peptidase inhibitor family I36 protein n=1 Tax=Nonomuraea sp. NPDC049625 TaxID=3155775 RepID=UPI003436B289